MVSGRNKFFIGGFFILAAVVYLILSSTKASVEYFKTVDELLAQQETLLGTSIRLSGAVVGDTISYNPDSLTLSFEVAHIPSKNEDIDAGGGLAAVLHEAVSDPLRSRILISYSGIRPDLLQNEAQAIMIGHLGDDGIFYADELLLKCPTKYEQGVPEQVNDN